MLIGRCREGNFFFLNGSRATHLYPSSPRRRRRVPYPSRGWEFLDEVAAWYNRCVYVCIYIYVHQKKNNLNRALFSHFSPSGFHVFPFISQLSLNSYYLEEIASRPRVLLPWTRATRHIEDREDIRADSNIIGEGILSSSNLSSNVARSSWRRTFIEVCRNGSKGGRGGGWIGARKHVVVWVVAYYLCSSRVSFVHYFALTEWSVFFFRFLRTLLPVPSSCQTRWHR